MTKPELIDESKKWGVVERTKLCREKASIGDHVIVYRDGKVLKRGRLVKVTSAGGNVFNPNYKKDGEFDSEDGAEFFFFTNNVGEAGGMVLI